jgi:hypothetical protein
MHPSNYHPTCPGCINSTHPPPALPATRTRIDLAQVLEGLPLVFPLAPYHEGPPSLDTEEHREWAQETAEFSQFSRWEIDRKAYLMRPDGGIGAYLGPARPRDRWVGSGWGPGAGPGRLRGSGRGRGGFGGSGGGRW